MRISDWSSDVCSSDLHGQLPGLVEGIAPSLAHHPVEHGVGMLPGMTFGVVGRGRQLALVVWRLPLCLPLATGSMTSRAVLLIDLAPGLDLPGVQGRPAGLAPPARKSVVEGKRVSVSVELGGAG